jgi:hypothetical protein
MATYTIRIYNQSLANKSYVVFMQPPVVSASGGTPPIYTNAWATFENVTNGSWDTVEYSDTTYAYWTPANAALTPGAVLDSGGAMPVNTATGNAVTFSNTGATGFTSVASPDPAQNGSFSITSPPDFTPANSFVFGLASHNGGVVPAPTACFQAQPNETYNITPVVKFYVADGLYTPGQVIDVPAISDTCAAIDFTGQPQTTATVAHGPNGAFTVTYS